jgi:hypothetical protein
VTREEARRLLSGYATGSLTELERQLLFDASLEDQDLFDELAGEQTVKELMEIPGAKRRLLEALGPEKRALAWWPWAAGVAAVATIAIAVWVARAPREARLELAQATKSEAVSEAVAPSVPLPQVATNEQAAQAEAPAAKRDVEAPVTPPPAPAEKSAALTDNLGRVEADSQRPVPAQLETRARQERPVAVMNGQPANAVGAANGLLAQGPRAAAESTVGGGTLTYEVRETGILRMTPSRTGVLEVTFDGRPLFPSRAVAAGLTIDVSIPLEAKQLRIDFAAEANAPEVAPQNQGITGTLTLPSSPNPRAVIVIPAQR